MSLQTLVCELSAPAPSICFSDEFGTISCLGRIIVRRGERDSSGVFRRTGASNAGVALFRLFGRRSARDRAFAGDCVTSLRRSTFIFEMPVGKTEKETGHPNSVSQLIALESHQVATTRRDITIYRLSAGLRPFS